MVVEERTCVGDADEDKLAALAERQGEEPLHEVVAPCQQAVALVQDDELGLLPRLALESTELQKNGSGACNVGVKGGVHLVVAGGVGRVRTKKGGQKHSGVGLGHAVNKIGLDFALCCFLENPGCDIHACSFACAGWTADVEAARLGAARGASDEGGDKVHLLLTHQHVARNILRLQSLKSSVTIQLSRKEYGDSTAVVASTSCMLMPSSISSASASDASPKPEASDASQSLTSEAVPAVEMTSDTICKGNATSGSSSSLHGMAMRLAAAALLRLSSSEVANECRLTGRRSSDCCRC